MTAFELSNADTVEEQATLLHDELTKLEIGPSLSGHSWGGSLVLAYAMAYPDDIAGMVLIAPAAYPDKGDPLLLRLAGKVPFVGELGALLGRSVLSRGMVKGHARQTLSTPAGAGLAISSSSSSWMGRKQLKDYFDDEAQLNDSLVKLADRYADIQTPTVIITGDNDRIVDAKHNARQLHKVMKKSRIIRARKYRSQIRKRIPRASLKAIGMINSTS